MNKRRTKNRYSFLAWLVATIIIFIAVVNTIPGLVANTSNIPVLGKIITTVEFGEEPVIKKESDESPLTVVKTETKNVSVSGNPIKDFSFENGIATGGQITDNVNVKSISVTKDGNVEHLSIGFTQRGEFDEPQLVPPFFEIVYQNRPYTMTFFIHGARAFDANDFEDLKKSDFVEDAYWLVTHDDSLIRFVVVFKGPVLIEGKEFADPAKIILSISEDEHTDDTKRYAVRTAPYLFGGKIANLEGFMHEEEGLRILRENGILFSSLESEFYIEIGSFDNKEDAEKRAVEINEKYGPEIHVYVEAK
ncbi:hypothetical protein AB1K89_00140 [Sporosarcina sp. 179-K 8C2 HS]|uniref:hypothetical protein n=1 Tax=Sporosarcina sp. 179-K 8C2 HS TaxID=3142387 RepID=UPI0039A02D61